MYRRKRGEYIFYSFEAGRHALRRSRGFLISANLLRVPSGLVGGRRGIIRDGDDVRDVALLVFRINTLSVFFFFLFENNRPTFSSSLSGSVIFRTPLANRLRTIMDILCYM